MTGHTTEPLVVKNDVLGYMVYYDLNHYIMDFENDIMSHDGYVSFEEFGKVSRRAKRNREDVYRSSIRRFLRSLYHERLDLDKFVVNKFVYELDLEWHRTDSLLNIIDESNDSTRVYRKIVSGPSHRRVLAEHVKERDIVIDHSNGIKEIPYKGYELHVQPNPNILDAQFFRTRHGASGATALIHVNAQSVWIDALGNYFPVTNWRTEGYWGWFSNLSTLLPMDYGLD